MKTICKKFYRDDRGAILSAELIVISTILVLGLIVGLSSVQTAINGELFDISRAFCSLNQNYYIRGFRGCKAWTASSFWGGSSICNTCAAGIGVGGFGLGGDAGTLYGDAVMGQGSTVIAPPTYSAPAPAVVPSTPKLATPVLPPTVGPVLPPCDASASDCPPGTVVKPSQELPPLMTPTPAPHHIHKQGK